jgi:hypothetical protein
MTHAEIAAELRIYNRWRRGDDHVPHPEPRDLGEVIDAAIAALESTGCPWCESDDITTTEGTTFRWVAAECGQCGARGPEIRRQTTGEGNPAAWAQAGAAKALEAWKMRGRP